MTEDVDGPDPLPEGSRLLHIGPPKTGSTSIQAALAAQREELPAHGAAYPGKGLRWLAATRQVVGERALADREGQRRTGGRAWRRLRQAVSAQGDLRVCISNEIFARADDDGARRAVQGLGGDRVHVVLVAREFGRLLTSQWQERIKQSAGTDSLEGWLEAVLDPAVEAGPHRHFWRQQDLVSLVERWSRAAGGRVVVVVADHRDRRSVGRAFESLLGLPEGMLDQGSDPRNRSLTHGRVQLLRELDTTARDLGWPRYVRGLRRDLVKTMAAHPLEDWETQVRLPEWALRRVREVSERHVAGLRDSGVRVVGDLDVLLQPPGTDDDQVVDPRLPVGLVRELVVASRLEGARLGSSGAREARGKRRRKQVRPDGGRREDA